MINAEVKVNIIRSVRKTLSIQLKRGEIIARAPLRMKDKEIYSFIESKKSWIEKILLKWKSGRRYSMRCNHSHRKK